MPKMGENKDREATTPFTLKNTSGGFEGRRCDIFSQLDILEKKHISHEQNRTDLDEFADLTRNEEDDGDAMDRTSAWKTKSGKRRADDAQQRKGNNFGVAQDAEQDSELGQTTHMGEKKQEGWSDEKQPARPDPQFRIPSGRAPGRQGRLPDHGKRPHNWTHYSLEDVTGSDMSEKSNTQAAMAFLEERRQLKVKESMKQGDTFDVGSAACSKGMISFAKRSKTKSSDNDDLGKSVSSGAEDIDESETLPASTSQLVTSDREADAEQTLDEDKLESSVSSANEDTVQTGFKSRKGIRRNIRTRDDDD